MAKVPKMFKINTDKYAANLVNSLVKGVENAINSEAAQLKMQQMVIKMQSNFNKTARDGFIDKIKQSAGLSDGAFANRVSNNIKKDWWNLNAIWWYPLLALLLILVPSIIILIASWTRAKEDDQVDYIGKLSLAEIPLRAFGTLLQFISMFLVPVLTANNMRNVFIKMYNSTDPVHKIKIDKSATKTAWMLLFLFIVVSIISIILYPNPKKKTTCEV